MIPTYKSYYAEAVGITDLRCFIKYLGKNNNQQQLNSLVNTKTCSRIWEVLTTLQSLPK